MKKNTVIDVLKYENFILKTKYNEVVQYSINLQNELKMLKERSSEPHFGIISFLQEKNAKLNKELITKNKELNEKKSELTKLVNEPFVLLETESINKSQPLFHVSRYKVAPSSLKYENDTISEITQE